MELPEAGSDGIIADAKWLGSKALAGAKAVGGAIDKAYDATKAGVKKAGSAVINAPGNAVAAVKKFKKDHNFTQVDNTATGAKCLTHKEWKPCREDPACNWNLIWQHCEEKR